MREASFSELRAINLSKICLSDSRFAYEKFANVSKEIRGWANASGGDRAIGARDEATSSENQVVAYACSRVLLASPKC